MSDPIRTPPDATALDSSMQTYQLLSVPEQQVIRASAALNDEEPSAEYDWSNEIVWRLLVTIDAEREANRAERDQWSHAAALLGLAPYGGAYDAKMILPAIQALMTHNRELQRRLGATRTRFGHRPVVGWPPLPESTPTSGLPPVMDQCADTPVLPARLDPDGTAKGKTILTAPQVGANGPIPWPGQERTHVDTETGTRTPLNALEELQAQAATSKLGHDESAPRRGAVYCVHGPHITPGLFCKCPPECPCRRDDQCPKASP